MSILQSSRGATASLILITVCFSYLSLVFAHNSVQYSNSLTLRGLTTTLNGTGLAINSIPYSTRQYWMRQANQALYELAGPCPFAAFGAVVVNHTGQTGLGEVICIGANTKSTGNPTLHGEIAAISNCSKVLTDPDGPYNLTAAAAITAFSDLSLYTNAESCPMCASAIRWSNFKEYIYGTTIDTLINTGWGQIRISSYDIFKESFELPGNTRMIGDVLTDETDPLFMWQYDPGYSCPEGCARTADGLSCEAS